VILGVQVVTMFLRGWFPEFHVPGFSMGLLGGPYAAVKDFFQAAVLVGILIALFRWTVTKPQRLMGFLPAEARLHSQKHGEAILILVFIGLIMTSGFFYDAGRIVLFAPTSPDAAREAAWQPLSLWLSSLLAHDPGLAQTVATVSWWTHNLVILVFLNLLPLSKHFHIITSIPNVFLGKVEPKGRLAKTDFTVETPRFGTSLLPQFSWKQVLDMYSCTECGRCSSFCPATATGKPLAPRQFLLNLRDHLYENQDKVLKATGTDGFEPVVGEGRPVIDEVIWSCVNCRACEEACPVNIEYVDKIDEIRQHLVQEASRFPEELNRTFRGLETQSNPWGISSDERASWAEGLDVPIITQKPDAEYLYYVGCGGSFDSHNRKATQAFVKILKGAGVSFAILGKEELCNGETARRLGNEYLYQTMAEQLAGVINRYNVKKILVNCPHCFNTLKNEYPEFGGNWDVESAAVFVNRLKEEGKLKLTETFQKNVVYHDSCNYGRFNDIYEEPRALINAVPGAKLTEMDLNRSQGTCCGAGGGRMWMEERADQRVNVMRTDQALEKNPQVIATSCPYCRIMMGSGINEKGMAEKVEVMDVMEIVAKNMASQPTA
jgi:Fe-S oxidoreductase